MTYTSNLPTAQSNLANQAFLQQLVTQPNAPMTQPKSSTIATDYEHPLLMKQGNFWSRAILWSLVGTATGTLIWANMAVMEEAVPAQGKLEPQGTVKDVQAPANGVVKAVYVKEGERVKKGQKLFKLDQTAILAQLKSLKLVKASLEKENAFYQAQLEGRVGVAPPSRVNQSLINLTRSRSTILSETRYLNAQLTGDLQGLTAEQQARLQFNQVDLQTRTMAARLQANQLVKQLNQAQVKRSSVQEVEKINQDILDRIAPLAAQGAISKVQMLKQQQEVMTNRSENDQLEEEMQRLLLAIEEAKTKVDNTAAVDGKEVMAMIAMNEQKLAQIDSELTKAILENDKKISDVEAQIQQTAQMVKYSDVVAPADGLAFEVKAKNAGVVVQAAEPIMKIVPQEDLVAKVSLTNRDIGFVRQGMTVDVRVDSFPFSEYGDIKGELVWIGSDALPPTQIQPNYTFPAKIKLKRQSLKVKGKPIPLQSGMSLSANIKVRDRKVMDVFTEQFTRGMESLKFMR
jgi:hemolysin D